MTDALRTAALDSKAWPYEEARKILKRYPDGKPGGAPILFETPHGVMRTGGAGPRNTRLLFPQTSADLSVRWCSAALKIGVGAASVAGQDRFLGRRTLVVTGERAVPSTTPGCVSRGLRDVPVTSTRRR